MGFVRYMTVERIKPGAPSDIYIEEPSLEQILNAISAMDGATSTYVMLHPGDPDENVFLAIGGGNEGRFLVNHWDGNTEVEQRVILPSVTSDEWVDVMMVQLTERKAREIVDLATALKVATHFEATGQLTDEVCWKLE
jgi:hypothetical protein